MDHRVPRVGVWVGLLLALAAIVTFVFLNNRFEGPGDPIKAFGGADRADRHVREHQEAARPSSRCCSRASRSAGSARSSGTAGGGTPRSRSRWTTTSSCARDAVLRIGERSLLGDPFLDVVTRGSRSLPALGDGDQVANTEPSVNFDEALDFLDKDGRADVRSLLGTVARGVPTLRGDEPLNGTVGGLSRTIAEAHELTSRRARPGGADRAGWSGAPAWCSTSSAGARTSIRTIVGSGRIDARRAGLRHPVARARGRRAARACWPPDGGR